jgi:hypothetical protein
VAPAGVQKAPGETVFTAGVLSLGVGVGADVGVSTGVIESVGVDGSGDTCTGSD